ncbi:glycosyltransferase family 2 protein [Alicyclobacillus tolerans]|uniref:glycosyltransferase family 2 protein n=1 Tax=Alicyclobacillus tolerans TaxID=90970 RepID=UPI003B760827
MVSVLLVTYQSSKVLESCLKHLADCSMADQLEIILVDNASRMEDWEYTKKLLDMYQENFYSVKSMRLDKNLGYAYANNRGAENAEGEYLLLLNPDCYVGKDAIEKCLHVLENRQDIGAVGCQLRMPNGELDLACKRSLPTLWNSAMKFSGMAKRFSRAKWIASYNLTYLPDDISCEVGCICGAFLLTRMSLYRKLSGLDEDYFMYGEDIDFCKRLKDRGFLIWYLGETTSIHVKGGNGGKKSKKSLHSFYNSMDIYFRKNSNHARLSIWMVQCLIQIILFLHKLKFDWVSKSIKNV